MRIGLALSGGGFRATVFHLGVLGRLAVENRLEDVTHLSTVSGGSLCAGLVYAHSDLRFPTSEHLRKHIIPHARMLLTKHDVQSSFLKRMLGSPFSVLQGRAYHMARVLEDLWDIDAHLCDLPEGGEHGQPVWIINASCYETGHEWRFSSTEMGDPRFGFVKKPPTLITDAIAASSGVPGLIGSLEIDARKMDWVDKNDVPLAQLPFDKVHLWDGGVFDNLGVKPLVYYSGVGHFGYRHDIEFLLLSDASGKFMPQPWGHWWHYANRLMRLIDIAGNQVKALRVRSIVAHFIRQSILTGTSPGNYLLSGRTCRKILDDAGWDAEAVEQECLNYLPEPDAAKWSQMETTLRQLGEHEFDGLLRHGFEVADLFLHAYSPDNWELKRYSDAYWG